MYSFVNLEILGSCEYFATALVRTGKRLLTSVNTNVIDQLVLGFERLVGAFTTSPVARVIALLCSAHVIDGQMSDQLHDRRESSTTFPLPLAAALQ